MQLFILQTVIPDYRSKFFAELKKQLYDELGFACGDNYFEKSVRTDWSIKSDVSARGLEAAICMESCLPKFFTASELSFVSKETITANFEILSLTTVCK